MANVDRPSGLRPIGSLDGSPYNGPVRHRPVDSSNGTAIFVGDAVILEDDGNVAPASAGGNILGVCVGVVVDRAVAATEHPGYLPASTAGTILVVEGPDVLFEIQEDDVDGTALTRAAIGSNADILATAGSTTTGVSAHELDRSTITDDSPATATLRIIELVDRDDNEVGDYAKWIVRINEHMHRETTGL